MPIVMSIVNRPRARSAGELVAGAAIIAGEGTVTGDITGEGFLASGLAIIEGAGTVEVPEITGDGVLVAGAALMVGEGTVETAEVTGTGELAAGAAIIVGEGPLVGAGALVAGSAIVVGEEASVTPDYTNPGGMGDRTTDISIITSLSRTGGQFINLLDGEFDADLNDACHWAGLVTGQRLIFDFQYPRLITEARFYADGPSSQGTWKWQGSNTANGADWTDLSTTFNFQGGANNLTPNVLGDLSANATEYRYYQLLQTALNTSNTPWDCEFEFKIAATGSPEVTQYSNPLGAGNRTISSAVFVTTTVMLGGSSGNIQRLVDGEFRPVVAAACWFQPGQSGRRITFDFATSRVITEARVYSDIADPQGTWKWQGSDTNNGSDWVDISAGFTFTGAAGSQIPVVQGDMSANTTPYRYYSMLQTAGVTDDECWFTEMEFKIDA